MTKLQVGFVGWRGMVGSVLMQRMADEHDSDVVDLTYFSTSQAGQDGPDGKKLKDAFSETDLQELDVVLTCQGSDYTKQMHTKLRQNGWVGYWIDAASALRMEESAVLLLDPVNRRVIDEALDNGIKDLIGVNCTVSPMMMGLAGLFNANLVEWISAMTYQAASGAGARQMIELLQQMHSIGSATEAMIENPSQGILNIDKKVKDHVLSDKLPLEHWPAPLAANVLPWIDKAVDDGQSREEWKGMVETNKILGGTSNIPIDGTCVRVGTMRSHALGLTVKLKEDKPLEEIESLISDAHEWVKLVPNNPDATVRDLSAVAASGSLKIHVGRVRKSKLGPDYLNAFVVGDQLLWGAAEPLRRALRILVERHV